MPELVEIEIIPSTVHCCLVLSRRLPEAMPDEAKAQFMAGLWDMAQKDDQALADMLQMEATATPFKVEILVVQSSDVDFTQSSVVALRKWIDSLIPTMSEPYYRMFVFPSHAMIREQRYDFVYGVLIFGNQSEELKKNGNGAPVKKKPWWRFW